MKRQIVCSALVLMLWIACGGDEDGEPNVQITYPHDGSGVSGTVDITVEATDDDSIESVEFYIDDSLVATSASEPYIYSWDTSSLPDSSSHTIYARAYDTEGNEGISPTVSVVVYEQGALKWRYQLEGDTRFSPAIGADGTIYIASVDAGGVYAINPNGTLMWYYNEIGNVNGSLAVGDDGTLYCGSFDCCIYAVNSNGTLKWRYQTSASVANASVAIGSDGTIYCRSCDGYLYAMNPDGTLKWRYQCGNNAWVSMAIGSDGTIYFTSNGRYALNPDGTLKWHRVGVGLPAIGLDGTIYFGFTAVNPDGTIRWSYAGCPGASAAPVIGFDGTIYAGSYDGYFYALNPDGTLKWRVPFAASRFASAAIGSDGTIYVGLTGISGSESDMVALNPDGSTLWTYRTGSDVESSPTIGSDGTIYVGVYEGFLYAFYGSGTLANTPWPKFHHGLQNTGRVGG